MLELAAKIYVGLLRHALRYQVVPGPGRRGEVVIDSGSKKIFPKFALRKMDILPR